MSSRVPREIREAIEQFVKRVKRKYKDAEVYLFGSYVKEEWIEGRSDVDLIVLSDDFRKKDFVERIVELRSMASKRIGFEIFPYTREEFEQVRKRSVVIRDAVKYWKKVS